MTGGLGDFVQGAAGGGMAGSSFGPWGAAIGAGVGGFAGLFGGNQNKSNDRKRLEDYYNESRDRAAPQVGQSAVSNNSSFRNNQQDLINHLEAMSQGRGPSLAAEQFKASNDRNVAQQQALAQSGQGNATAAAMGAANNSAQLGAQSAQDAGQARIAEQQMALNQLGYAAYGARNQDEENSRFNAGQSNQFQLANLDAKLKQQGMNDATRLQILAQMSGGDNQPQLSERILAGGSSMYAMGATNAAQNRGSSTRGGVQTITKPSGYVPY